MSNLSNAQGGSTAASPATPPARDDRWRKAHLGYLMGRALQRFDARVLERMAQDENVPLALANLARRHQVGAAHIHITRHLPLTGARLTDLAASAGMSKQAMGKLVDQCEAWALVRRAADSRDARAKWVAFTPLGLIWLQAFEDAVAHTEAELRQSIGAEIATVIALGLEAYAG